MYLPSDEEMMPWRSHKDRRRWCGGHKGREHTPIARVAGYWDSTIRRFPNAQCGDMLYRWSRKPWCKHELVCAACNKVLIHSELWDTGHCPERKL